MKRPYPMPQTARLVPIVFAKAGQFRPEVAMVRAKPFKLPKAKAKGGQ